MACEYCGAPPREMRTATVAEPGASMRVFQGIGDGGVMDDGYSIDTEYPVRYCPMCGERLGGAHG